MYCITFWAFRNSELTCWKTKLSKTTLQSGTMASFINFKLTLSSKNKFRVSIFPTPFLRPFYVLFTVPLILVPLIPAMYLQLLRKRLFCICQSKQSRHLYLSLLPLRALKRNERKIHLFYFLNVNLKFNTISSYCFTLYCKVFALAFLAHFFVGERRISDDAGHAAEPIKYQPKKTPRHNHTHIASRSSVMKPTTIINGSSSTTNTARAKHSQMINTDACVCVWYLRVTCACDVGVQKAINF